MDSQRARFFSSYSIEVNSMSERGLCLSKLYLSGDLISTTSYSALKITRPEVIEYSQAALEEQHQ